MKTLTSNQLLKSATSNTKKLLASTVGVAVALGAVAIAPQSAKAASFGNSLDCNDNSCSLQSLLDGMTTSGPGIDTVNDQSAVELFTPNASSSSTSSLLFEVAGNAADNEFGIYKKGDTGSKITLFDGPDSPNSEAPFANQATLHFASNGDVKLDNTVYSGFGNEFGYYLKNKKLDYFYTEDALNPNGNEQSVIYQGNGSKLQIPNGAGSGNFDEHDWIVAFEDLPLADSDSDYNDFAILASDVEPVPEPATMAGLGLVGAAMALSRRRNNKKNS